jgi:thiol-disulfide isomerase/thioredoxin
MPQSMHTGDTLYLKAYKGKSLHTINKMALNEQGIARFTGEPALPCGMYAIGTKNTGSSFDFLISDNQPQRFLVTYDTANIPQSIFYTGSKENTAFSEYRNKNGNSAFNDIVMSYKQYSMLSLYIKSHSDMEEYVLNKDAYKQHYFDNIDFANECITRMPLLEGKLFEYFFHVLNPIDTTELKWGIDDVLNKAAANVEVYTFCTGFLYEIFIGSPLPGHEKIAEYIAYNYIFAGFTSVFDTDFVARVKSEINWVSMNPVGSIAPDVKLQSIAGDYIKLSDIKAKVTVLLFLDPDCSVCREVVPLVYAIYRDYKNKGLEVYAVYPGYEADLWKSYIIKEKLDWINVWGGDQPDIIFNNYNLLGLPAIYLLDNDKRIITKEISVEELDDLLNEIFENPTQKP